MRVSTRPAAFTAATRVVWSLEWTALSMMSLLAYIGAPPTIGFSPMALLLAKAPVAVRESAAKASVRVRRFLIIVWFVW